MANVIIGCKLPNGIVLSLSLPNGDKTVTLQGMNASKIVGATYMPNTVDSSFWDAWKLLHADFEPFKSNAIFEASSERHATDKGKELANEKTGFEKMKQDAGNVKPATSKD